MTKAKTSPKKSTAKDVTLGSKILWQKVNPNLLPIVLFTLLIILIIVTYQVWMIDKFYPQTLVGNTNISFLTYYQAEDKFSDVFLKRSRQKLEFRDPEGSFTIDLATASATIDYSILNETQKYGRQGSFFTQVKTQFQTLIYHQKIYPKITLSVDKQLDEIAAKIDKPPQNAQLNFNETVADASLSARIQIKESKDGLTLDRDLLTKAVTEYLLTGRYQTDLPIKVVPPKITTGHVERAKKALESSQKESIKLKFQGNIWLIDTKQLLALLDLTSGSNLLLDRERTENFIQKIAKDIDQDVQEGLFEFNPQSKRVTTFRPSQEGEKLDVEKTYDLITEALSGKASKNILLPVSIIKPKIQTADVNSLGIKELLGRGISNFSGSIANRIYNINLAASRINGVLIAPGEEFSFNDKVGDISAASGYKPAYVIKQGRTVLDDGGGVCQVSTTVFRAVLNAGLPVTARTAHAYRVGYYEQGFPPGLDATVWAPSVDFRFKNDTPSHILIQAYIIGATLYVDLYGTSDGRITQLSKPHVSNQTPPLPELRQEDLTLPKGVVKQVDWAAWGAQVSFSRNVKRGGETIISETYKSNYRPWQAVYLVGTKE